jgi:hypothetical protein
MSRNKTNPSGYRHAGDYFIDTCMLTLANGESADVKDIASEINIYQDLTKHYMECDIVVDDANGIISDFDGFAIVRITFSTEDEDEKVLSFAIYELTNKIRLTDREETYTLHGISEEAYITSSKKISRAFGKGSGNTVDKMVQGIYKEFFNSQKPIETDSTKSKHRFIIPNMTIDDTIKFMKREAVSDSIASVYFFYEDFNGFHFKDIATLIEQEPKETYKYHPMNFDSSDDSKSGSEYEDVNNIISYAQKKQKSYLQRIQNGQFKSNTINIDLLRKNKKEVKFDYDKQHTRFKTFSNKKFNSHDIGENAVINLMTSRKDHDNDSILSPEGHIPKKINQQKAYRDSYMQNFMQVVDVRISGNPNINVGDIVDLQIPKMGLVKDKDEKTDKYVSGKYLITSARHQFTGRMYTISLECVRDAGEEV